MANKPYDESLPAFLANRSTAEHSVDVAFQTFQLKVFGFNNQES